MLHGLEKHQKDYFDGPVWYIYNYQSVYDSVPLINTLLWFYYSSCGEPAVIMLQRMLHSMYCLISYQTDIMKKYYVA